MINDSPHLYRRDGIQSGSSSELIETSLRQALRVESRGLKSVLTLKHLAHQSGASHKYLRRIVEREIDPYQEFRRRETKKARLISAPEPPLMEVQRWLLYNILGKVPASSASFAYERAKSISKCAARHVGCRWLVKLDLHDFFSSIDEKSVYRVFHELGYSKLVALELARICTRVGIGAAHKRSGLSSRSLSRYRAIESYTNLSLGFLPQGAPTSGALANLVMRPIDEELLYMCSSAGLVYTRYADDLTFSSINKFDRKAATLLIREIGKLLTRSGLLLHEKKTRIIPPGARMIVLGLLVDHEHVRLSVDFRRRLIENIRGVEKFGLVAHVKHRSYSSTLGFVEHMRGLLAYAFDVEPEWTRQIWLRWSAALYSSGFSVRP